MLRIPTRQLRPTASPRRSSFRPILEALEDRCVPTTFSVDTLLDTVDANPGDGLAADADGATSLRAAIMEANATAGDDTIILPAGTYPLTILGAGEDAGATGDLDITDELTLTGADPATTIIDADHIDRVIDIIGVVPVSISGVTIRNGDAKTDFSGGGGVHLAFGPRTDPTPYTVTFTDCIISENTAVNGGGISNVVVQNNSLVLIRTIVADNTATVSDGSGVNDGGGIVFAPASGSLTLTDCIVRDNEAGRENGGILFAGGLPSVLTITGSTISGNSANRGIGGGITWFGSAFVLTNSTVSGNTAEGAGGGIITVGGNVTISNCTISDNTAGGNGGGISSQNTGSLSGPYTLTNVTITNNVADSNNPQLFGVGGGGICTRDSGTITLLNTIVAGNIDRGGRSPDCSGTITSQGHNLIQSTVGCTITGDTTANITGQDPLLGELTDNGGPTLTHLLLASSPAIDAGTSTDAPATDQRGISRPQGAGVDIGAVELVGAPTAGAATHFRVDVPTTVLPGTAFSITVTALDQFDNTATGYRGAVHFSSSDIDPNIVLPPNFTFSASDAGSHLFTNGVTLRTIGTQTITATDTGDSTLTDSAAVLVAPNGPTTFLVTNTFDSGSGSLRQAILNANLHGGSDAIHFQIGAGPQTIFVGDGGHGELPTITDAVSIDGATQPDFAGKPLIEISGARLTTGNAPGLAILFGLCKVKSLAINSFRGSGISLRGGRNLIVDNFIGTDLSGTFAKGNGIAGVEVAFGPLDRIVGNVISGNDAGRGVLLHQSADRPVVLGNFIGVDFTGKHALPNNTGVEVHSASATIGGTTLAARNVISGNGEGVLLLAAATIEGNFIGTDVIGTHALGNGVGIDIRADGATIGGTQLGERNIISGNLTVGIGINANAAIVQGNFIGADVLGTHAVANGSGIAIFGGADNLIGGDEPAARNVISGNMSVGIQLFPLAGVAPTLNRVQGNYIGTDVTGVRALDNQQTGVAIFAGSQNTIGGINDVAADGSINLTAGNVISGNSAAGVLIQGATATSNVVAGNFIGTTRTALASLANGNGVEIDEGATGNTVGGSNAGARNIISGNSDDGVFIHNGASGNALQGNFIGTDPLGAAPVKNEIGVHIDAPLNIIGGTMAGTANVISGNLFVGVLINAQGTGNVIQGNLIGTDLTGTAPVPNLFFGISIDGTDNLVGGTAAGAGNVVSGSGIGVRITGAQNVVQGNLIGTDRTGRVSVGNRVGISIESSQDNTIGGITVAARNIISGNAENGVLLGGSNNQVLGNFIGTDVTGNSALGNGTDGVTVVGRENIIGGAMTGAGNVISGNGRDGVLIRQGSDNFVLGNFIGTNAEGDKALPNGTTTGNGVEIFEGVGNRIGGAGPASRNVISGNANNGVLISGGLQNQVQGNFIGTDISGTLALPNVLGNSAAANGIEILDSSNNLIGGTDPLARNIISGHKRQRGSGVHIGGGIFGLSSATGNLVQGNYIGTDVSGKTALPNFTGVLIDAAAHDNIIGGVAPGAGNLISGNFNGSDGFGVGIAGGAAGNLIQGNLIGADLSGANPLPNGTGVFIFEGSNNLIGGTAVGARNIISGNRENGIRLGGFGATASGNLVQGNFIGTKASGTEALANGSAGVRILPDASSNTIGGTELGALNVISGNGGPGISSERASSNHIQGNFIGTDLGGTSALPNSGGGIVLNSASGTVIGGSAPGAANVISGNAQDGILITGAAALVSGQLPPQNQVQGNLIGTDVTGNFALPNSGNGVKIAAGAIGNLIGGASTDAANVISGNQGNGVLITGAGTKKNFVKGNFIGTDVTSRFAIGNGLRGIEISGGAADNTIGGAAAGAGNVISGNAHGGVLIRSDRTSLFGNRIGTDVTGSFAVPNNEFGVAVAFPARQCNIGGTAAGAANVISGNAGDGLILSGASAIRTVLDHQVVGNIIGADITGKRPLGNTGNGVLIKRRASGNTIGGTTSGAANTIAFNGRAGVRVDSGNGNRILRNSIFANAGLGIELNLLTNANDRQKAPQLTSAFLNPARTLVAIQGTLRSKPNTTVKLEFFASTAGDPEGKVFLGVRKVSTNAQGIVNFSFKFPVPFSEIGWISATATDPDGNTSQFSGRPVN